MFKICRVLYKMALNPLSDYVFFLAQFQTFAYVLLYFAVLGYKLYGSKSVGEEQLEVTDKKIFFYIGAAEALSQVLGLVGASKIPGVVIPLLSQTVLIWQIVVGKIVLGRNLPAVQISGALIVIAGVCLAAFPGDEGVSVFSEVSLLYAGTYIASMFFPALSAVFKERIFSDAKEKLGGKDLDLFAVNSFGSAAQAGFVFLLLPVLCSLRGIDLQDLPQYLSAGLGCMLGQGEGCSTAPILAPAYVFCNLGFNIALLNLLRASSSVIQSLTLSSLVPITIAVFTLNLPYLDDPPQLGPNFIIGSVILSIGLLVYNSNKFLPAIQEKLGSK